MTAVELNFDGVALNDAALQRDWDEARFRCQRIAEKAGDAGMSRVLRAVLAVEERLGPHGSEPASGYGQAMLDLANAIDALQLGRPLRS